MALVDYDFYLNEYFGDTIDESSFFKWSSRAYTRMMPMLSRAITDADMGEHGTDIKKALCALADLLYQIDYSTKHATDPVHGNIKSMSSGGQSVSFGANDTLITTVISNKVAQDRLMIDTIGDYLHGTDLLYMGVSAW